MLPAALPWPSPPSPPRRTRFCRLPTGLVSPTLFLSSWGLRCPCHLPVGLPCPPRPGPASLTGCPGHRPSRCDLRPTDRGHPSRRPPSPQQPSPCPPAFARRPHRSPGTIWQRDFLRTRRVAGGQVVPGVHLAGSGAWGRLWRRHVALGWEPSPSGDQPLFLVLAVTIKWSGKETDSTNSFP